MLTIMPISQGRLGNAERLKTAKEANTFCQLTYLLHLVTTLNSYDNLESNINGYRSSHGGADDDSMHSLTVLESVAAILVQKHEIVATCYTSDTVSVMVAETDPNPSTDDSDPNPYIDDSDIPLPPGSHKLYPLHLAAVSNPDFHSDDSLAKNGKLNDTVNPHRLQILTNGQECWTKVRDSESSWYCAFL